MNFRTNDTVRLLENLPQECLLPGAIGVVVAEFTEPTAAYEVEFSNSNGHTDVQVALLPHQLALISDFLSTKNHKRSA